MVVIRFSALSAPHRILKSCASDRDGYPLMLSGTDTQAAKREGFVCKCPEFMFVMVETELYKRTDAFMKIERWRVVTGK